MSVIPAKAGIQASACVDPGCRRGDGRMRPATASKSPTPVGEGRGEGDGSDPPSGLPPPGAGGAPSVCLLIADAGRRHRQASDPSSTRFLGWRRDIPHEARAIQRHHQRVQHVSPENTALKIDHQKPAAEHAAKKPHLQGYG